jgi:hypothetical protein
MAELVPGVLFNAPAGTWRKKYKSTNKKDAEAAIAEYDRDNIIMGCRKGMNSREKEDRENEGNLAQSNRDHDSGPKN